jgi:hypothetical protein
LSFDGADGDPFSVSGTGWSEQGEQGPGTDLGHSSGAWGTKSQATAGATGNATVGCSTSDGAAYFQLAINPAGSNPSSFSVTASPGTVNTTSDATCGDNDWNNAGNAVSSHNQSLTERQPSAPLTEAKLPGEAVLKAEGRSSSVSAFQAHRPDKG